MNYFIKVRNNLFVCIIYVKKFSLKLFESKIFIKKSKMNSSTTLIFSNSAEVQRKPEIKTKVSELTLKLPKKVTWTEDTIDNEHMNKKKSKSKINLNQLLLNYKYVAYSKNRS